jgi:hypothetical protein
MQPYSFRSYPRAIRTSFNRIRPLPELPSIQPVRMHSLDPELLDGFPSATPRERKFDMAIPLGTGYRAASPRGGRTMDF